MSEHRYNKDAAAFDDALLSCLKEAAEASACNLLDNDCGGPPADLGRLARGETSLAEVEAMKAAAEAQGAQCLNEAALRQKLRNVIKEKQASLQVFIDGVSRDKE